MCTAKSQCHVFVSEIENRAHIADKCGCHNAGLQDWFYSVPPSKCQDNTLKQATTTSSQVCHS